MALICYADGSCPRPHESGGWAYAILMDGVDERTIYGSGRAHPATNNTMEIMAVMECMKRILKDRIRERPVIIRSDSQYVVNGTMTWMHTWADNDWLGVKNVELWKEMYEVRAKFSGFHSLRVEWVKGHAGVYWNEVVDRMAGEARKGRARIRVEKKESHDGN